MTAPTGKPKGRPPGHGAYSGRELLPITQEKVELVNTLLTGTTHVLGPSDAIAIELLARNLAKIEVIDRWLQVHGLFADKGGTPQPVLRIYWQAMNTAARLCGDLALNPSARIRLGLAASQARDFAAQMEEV